jgi:hypothetical protein
MRLLRTTFVAGVAALGVIAVGSPAQADAIPKTATYYDAGFWMIVDTREHNAGGFYGKIAVTNQTGVTQTRRITVVLYQCNGYGQNCGNAVRANGADVSLNANGTTYPLETSDYPGSYGHTYKACGSVSGTQILNACAPLMAYTTV